MMKQTRAIPANIEQCIRIYLCLQKWHISKNFFLSIVLSSVYGGIEELTRSHSHNLFFSSFAKLCYDAIYLFISYSIDTYRLNNINSDCMSFVLSWGLYVWRPIQNIPHHPSKKGMRVYHSYFSSTQGFILISIHTFILSAYNIVVRVKTGI